MITLTKPQFDALATLLRLRTGPSKAAAEMVFVGQLPQVEAARVSGCSVAGVSNVVRRVRNGHDLALKVVTRETT